jgi:hypothetical protein
VLKRHPRARYLSGLFWGLLLAGVSACGSAGSEASRSGESDGSPTANSSESPATSDSVDAKGALRGALVRWQRADTGAFTQIVRFPGGNMTQTGVYQMSTRTSRFSAAVESPDGQNFEFRILGAGDTSYMNTTAWPDGLGQCWLRFTSESIGNLTGMDTVAGAGGLPANVVALSYARGTRMSRDDEELVIGTVDLVSAASMFGSGVLKLFDDTTLKAPIGAEFTVADGEIVSWRMSGQSLSAALDRQGLLDGMSDGLRAALLEFEVEVEYDQMGSAEVEVRPPDRAHVMSGEQMESNEGCAAVR